MDRDKSNVGFILFDMFYVYFIFTIYRDEVRDVFKDYYYICFVTFGLAIFLFSIFIFYEKLRFMNGVNFVFAILIVSVDSE